MSRSKNTPFKRVRRAFDRDGLKRVCEMHETEFADVYGFKRVEVPQPPGQDFYLFQDNGADVLAVAHLDTVVAHAQRTCDFLDTAGGPVVYSGALDDRLGAYILLELLPSMGLTHDILLTTGEESARSTAAFFEPEKEYNWMIEFDRGGIDAVLYDYEDRATSDLVEDSGIRVGMGSFSDICYLEHLEVKGVNWGVGYQDYHSVRGHAFLEDTYTTVSQYLAFHDTNAEVYLPHDRLAVRRGWWGGGDPYRTYQECETCWEDPIDCQCSHDLDPEHGAQVELWHNDDTDYQSWLQERA